MMSECAGIDWGRWRESIRTPTPRQENPYGFEREEARAAALYDGGGSCGDHQHHMVSDGRGGGRCACGETVSADEL